MRACVCVRACVRACVRVYAKAFTLQQRLEGLEQKRLQREKVLGERRGTQGTKKVQGTITLKKSICARS